MLESVSLTPFSEPIPVTSRLDLLVFKPEKDQIMSKTSIPSIKDYLFLRKNIVLSTYPVYKIVWLNMLKSYGFFVFLFSLIDTKAIPRTRQVGKQILDHHALCLFQV